MGGRALGRLVFAVIFFGLLVVNGVATLMGVEFRQDFDENRTLASPVHWKGDVAAYVRDLDRYINDHFAFRKPLLLGFNGTLYRVLGSTLTHKVIIGRGDWLFGASFDGPQVSQNSLPESYYHAARLSFLERRDWLRERGIHLALMFFPVKDVVYSQYLPSYLQGASAQPSRSEGLYQQLGVGLADNIVPIRQELKAAAATGPEVYYRADSHANHLGAFVAYQTLARHLQDLAARGAYPAAAVPRPYPDYELKADRHYPSDYSRLIGVPREEFSLVPLPQPSGFTFHEVKPVPATARLLPSTARPRFMANSAGRGHVVLLGDSFTTRMAAYFGETFAQATAINMNRVASNEEQAFPAAYLDAVRPDLVVMSYVEMRLGPCEGACQDVVPIGNLADVRQTRLRRLYAEAQGPSSSSGVTPVAVAPVTGYTLARFTNTGTGPVIVRVPRAKAGPLVGEADTVEVAAGGTGYLFLTNRPSLEGPGAARTTMDTVMVAQDALTR